LTQHYTFNFINTSERISSTANINTFQEVEFFTEQSEMNEEDAIENQDIENL
jgi:hypothetical protein